MAIALDGTTDYIEIANDSALWATRTKFTAVVTLKVTGTVAARVYQSEWALATNGMNYILSAEASAHPAILVSDEANHFFQKVGASDTLSSGNTYHIVSRWISSSETGGPAAAMWINGASITLSDGFAVDSFAAMGAANNVQRIGTESGGANACVEGDYAEAALWNEKLDDATCLALSLGKRPSCFAAGIYYLKCTAVSGLDSEWNAATLGTPSVSGGVDATHPTMIPCGNFMTYYRRRRAA